MPRRTSHSLFNCLLAFFYSIGYGITCMEKAALANSIRPPAMHFPDYKVEVTHMLSKVFRPFREVRVVMVRQPKQAIFFSSCLFPSPTTSHNNTHLYVAHHKHFDSRARSRRHSGVSLLVQTIYMIVVHISTAQCGPAPMPSTSSLWLRGGSPAPLADPVDHEAPTASASVFTIKRAQRNGWSMSHLCPVCSVNGFHVSITLVISGRRPGCWCQTNTVRLDAAGG